MIQLKEKRKITMVTCYDFTSAQLLSETEVDMILVGDSVAMVLYGHTDTTSATLEMMATHIRSVRKGAPKSFIVGDLPFLSFRKSWDTSIDASMRLIQAGANAIKLEGAAGNLDLIRHLTESGVPAMGHLGLTPQFINAFGGFKVQGKTEAAKEQLLKDALALEKAGAFSIVLECVPSSLAAQVTKSLSIPVIGIGAGSDCDGQVLVLQDLLGLTSNMKPRFVRHFGQGREFFIHAINDYCQAVTEKSFPDEKEAYL